MMRTNEMIYECQGDGWWWLWWSSRWMEFGGMGGEVAASEWGWIMFMILMMILNITILIKCNQLEMLKSMGGHVPP